MEKEKALSSLLEIVSKRFSIEPSKVNLEANFHDLGVDSLDLVELIMDIEEKFGISFENEELNSFKCLGDVLSSISSKLN